MSCCVTGGSIEYSIDSGDPRGYFTIDSGSGQLRTAARLDHETVASVLLNIQARSGNPPAFGRAQVCHQECCLVPSLSQNITGTE